VIDIRTPPVTLSTTHTWQAIDPLAVAARRLLRLLLRLLVRHEPQNIDRTRHTDQLLLPLLPLRRRARGCCCSAGAAAANQLESGWRRLLLPHGACCCAAVRQGCCCSRRQVPFVLCRGDGSCTAHMHHSVSHECLLSAILPPSRSY
jgi:hypothetical protein